MIQKYYKNTQELHIPPLIDLHDLACPECGHIHQIYGFCGYGDCGCREEGQ